VAQAPGTGQRVAAATAKGLQAEVLHTEAAFKCSCLGVVLLALHHTFVPSPCPVLAPAGPCCPQVFVEQARRMEQLHRSFFDAASQALPGLSEREEQQASHACPSQL